MNTNTPFMYGAAVEPTFFTDREKESARLQLNFEHGINTIIISPRRWGKTSLVNKVAEQMRDNQQVRVVRMDAFSVRTQEDFYKMFATEIIRQTTTQIEEWMIDAKRFLSSLVPIVTMSSDPMSPVSLSLKSVTSDYGEEVLTLPERVAQAKNIKIVVCIDEFQQIGELSNSVTFQKKLRSVWQHQHSVSYCLYGSKRHLLTDMFAKSSYPFYKFGDIMFLERIPIKYWQEYIQSHFEQTAKHIDASLIEDIYSFVDGNSSYIQQLCWLVWMRTTDIATEEILEDAKRDLLLQNHSLFLEQINSLSSYQLRFIRVLMAGKSQELNRKETIEDFELGSSANVATIKKALLKKELIDIEGKKVLFSDPIFIHWLRRNAAMLNM